MVPFGIELGCLSERRRPSATQLSAQSVGRQGDIIDTASCTCVHTSALDYVTMAAVVLLGVVPGDVFVIFWDVDVLSHSAASAQHLFPLESP